MIYRSPVIKWNNEYIIGDNISGKNITTAKIRSIPYFSENPKNLYLARAGNTEESIFDPSSGGIGTRLKIAKLILTKAIKAKTLIKLIVVSTDSKPLFGRNLISKPKTVATKRFDTGPASAISGSEIVLFLRL